MILLHKLVSLLLSLFLFLFLSCYHGGNRASREENETFKDKNEIIPEQELEEDSPSFSLVDLNDEQQQRCLKALPEGYTFVDNEENPLPSVLKSLELSKLGIGTQGAAFRVKDTDDHIWALKIYYKSSGDHTKILKEEQRLVDSWAHFQKTGEEPKITVKAAKGVSGDGVLLKTLVKGTTLKTLINDGEFLTREEPSPKEVEILQKLQQFLFEMTSPVQVKDTIKYYSFHDLNPANLMYIDEDGGKWLVIDSKLPAVHDTRTEAVIRLLGKNILSKILFGKNQGFKQKLLRGAENHSAYQKSMKSHPSAPNYTENQFALMQDFVKLLDVNLEKLAIIYDKKIEIQQHIQSVQNRLKKDQELVEKFNNKIDSPELYDIDIEDLQENIRSQKKILRSLKNERMKIDQEQVEIEQQTKIKF